MNNRIEDYLNPEPDPEPTPDPGLSELEGAVMVRWVDVVRDPWDVPDAILRSVIGWPMQTGEEDMILTIASEISKADGTYGMVTRVPRGAVVQILRIYGPGWDKDDDGDDGEEGQPAWL